MMRFFFLFLSLFFLVACSELDNLEKDSNWTLTVVALKGGKSTRALSENGETLEASFSKGDVVVVYKVIGDVDYTSFDETFKVGEIVALSDGSSTTFTGNVNGVGLHIDDKLVLAYCGTSRDYSKQKGTLESIATECDYSYATVKITDIDEEDKIIGTEQALFENQQAICKLSFKDKAGNSIKVSRLIIGGEAGGNLANTSLSNLGDLDITLETPADVVFTAIHNINQGVKELYTFTIWDDHDIKWTCDINAILRDGKFYTTTLKMAQLLDTSQESDVVKTMLNTGLTLLDIETNNHVSPTCDYVFPPDGAMGRGITNTTKVPGRLRLMRKDKVYYDSGDFVEDESGITIRIRGNSSAYVDKKPYKIHLSKKSDLLLRGNKDYADKDWLLIKDEESYTNNNEMSLRPLIGLKMNELIGMPYSPSCQYVNVVLNGEYKGIYLLVESIKRNQKCRIDVSKNGYVIEYDPYWWNEAAYFATRYTSVNDWYKYTFKYPDSDEVTESQISCIRDYVNAVEYAIDSGNYTEFIDVESFAKWHLVFDILGCNDSGGTNMFMTKYDNTSSSKLTMGPTWDFDGIMREDGWPRNRYNNMYENLINSTNNAFITAVKNLYLSKGKTIMNELESFLDAYSQSEEGAALNKSRVYEDQLWGDGDGIAPTVQENVLFVKDWLSNRKVWLDDIMSKDDSYWKSK